MVIKNKKIKPNSNKKKITFRTFVDTIFKFKKNKNYNYKINSDETQLKNNIKMIFDNKELKQKIDLVLTDFLNKKINYFLTNTSMYKRIIFKCGSNTSYISDKLAKSIYIFGKGFETPERNRILLRPGSFIADNCDIIKKHNLNFDKILKMKLGGKHCLILLKTGELYAYGSNSFGQCGNDYDKWIESPKEITYFKNLGKIKNIYCGYNFSFVLMKNNKLFSFGSNYSGQLGIGNNNKNEGHSYLGTPQLVKLNETIKIKKVFTSAISYHAFLLTNEGIFGFGNNKKNQIDPTSIEKKIKIPKKIIFTNKSLINAINQNNIIKIYCSIKNSFICRRDKKNNTIFYDIGKDHMIKNIKNENEKKKIIKIGYFKKQYPGKRVTLASTCNSIIFLVEGGTVYGVGNKEKELLLKYNPSYIKKIKKLNTKKISKIKAGKNFYIACNKKNEFFSWGDDKNNQLGLINSLKSYANSLYEF